MSNPVHPSVPLSLSGRVALITGGSRGIGAACVRLFRQDETRDYADVVARVRTELQALIAGFQA